MFLIKKTVSTLLVLAMLFSVSAFAEDNAINTGWFNDTAIDGYDTVAYFTQNKPVEGNKTHQVKWRDANWYFVSEANKNLFLENPEKYAPQYGGWCAYAMADEGSTVGIDPDAFYIHDNKLYLNYNKSVQKKWQTELLTMIKDADHYYPLKTDVKRFIKE